MKLELVLLDGSDRRYPLNEGAEITVGSAAQSTLRLTSLDVSRSHALLVRQQGRVTVLDLGSTNGTFVNGKRVKERELLPGDVIRFSSVLAQLMPPAAPEPECPPPAPRPARGRPRTPDPPSPTSDHLPATLQESLIWLLTRWAAADGTAYMALVEWLVRQRGLRAAAVLQAEAGEIIVEAAHGAIHEVLDDASCEALVKTPREAGPAVEIVQLALGGSEVLAVRCRLLPWLLLVPCAARPEVAEVELYAKLLALARRLDGGQPPPTRA
ncbi:MAG: FHA domain-containing protein [Acidobacteriota bacterium]